MHLSIKPIFYNCKIFWMWTENFHMYKLNLENAEEPEIQLPTYFGSHKKQGKLKKKKKNLYFCFIDYANAFDHVHHKKLWKILKDVAIPDYFPISWDARHETAVRAEHGTMVWFKIGKGIHQDCILSACLLNLHAEYIMWNSSLDDSQAGIKIDKRNISNLRYADDTTLMAEKQN